jgi:Mlc titration factor MtfA (ptsG expression regulator)
LRADGNSVERERRHWRVTTNAAALRQTQLFRTLLHEMGHHVDYVNNEATGLPWSRHTKDRKEDFAHRYAQTVYDRLQAKGVVPFAPKSDEPTLMAGGLQAHWFRAPEPSADDESSAD